MRKRREGPFDQPLTAFTALRRVSPDFVGTVVHNHPSGDPTPSKADIAMTREVVDAGAKLGIAVHDHLVIGKAGHASFKSLGLL